MTIRPYLVLPKLVEQPTWGGTYIVEYKLWSEREALKQLLVGQSYELYGSSHLALDLSDSDADSYSAEGFTKIPTIQLDSLSPDDARILLGSNVYEAYHSMPLLIKFTQAKGNSFQLHKKPSVEDPYWIPKAESWYFFEDGYITLGIKHGVSVEQYKQVCVDIDHAMQVISQRLVAKEISFDQAMNEAKEMIASKNPWQYVNVHRVQKDTVLDLSEGGLHHSWEEDPNSATGNIVYEVQQDSPDETSTLRSFDQGKIKSDRTIRPLTIEKYFQFLDTDPAHNDIQNAQKQPVGDRLLTTNNYYMDLLHVSDTTTVACGNSFAHLFVREGKVTVTAGEGNVRLSKGHSCLVPQGAHTFQLQTHGAISSVIRTGIE